MSIDWLSLASWVCHFVGVTTLHSGITEGRQYPLAAMKTQALSGRVRHLEKDSLLDNKDRWRKMCRQGETQRFWTKGWHDYAANIREPERAG